VGEGQPRITTSDVEFDKAEAEAFLAGRSTTLPTRRVTIVLINPQTQQAARALIEPSQGRIITVESIAASEAPFLHEDAERLWRSPRPTRTFVGRSAIPWIAT